ncbi:rRNA-processing protein EBP2 [Microsporum ferrugineum]
MAKKSKLLSALDAHKGRNFELERQKKLQKEASKRKNDKQLKNAEEEGEENADQSNGDVTHINGKEKSNGEKAKGQKGMKMVDDKKKQEDNESEEEEDTAADSAENEANEGRDEDEDEEVDEEEDQEEEEEEEDIPLSDLSGDEAADVIPHQRLTINNSAAILSSLKRISFINDQTPFSEHQSLTSTETMDIPDPNDDLNRELAFYKVCAAAAKTGRSLLKKEGIPFSRPTDYFAEMVKDDEHMDKIKKKMYEEAASKKASADAKKQRDLKKFGKQVQIAKIQERQKEKRETLEKINDLKRKRRGAGNGEAEESELFDVTLEESSRSDSRRGPRGKDGEGSRSKRQKKDAKFGFGGKKRFAKSGDAISSGDLSSFSTSKMKGKKTGAAKRLGKGRRQARR